VNQGLSRSTGDFVCLLNNDTVPAQGWLNEMIGFFDSRPEFGLLNPLCNGHAQEGKTLNDYARAILCNRGVYMEMNQCQGFCMLIKRALIDKIGFLDERFGLGGFDDTDYSMRAHKAGYRCAAVYSSYVYHKEHKSFNELGDRKKIQLNAEKEYFKKWPRHLRAALILNVSRSIDDKYIENFLKDALYLAREWCWVNIMIFGGKPAEERIERVKKAIGFPMHQNLKFNYLNSFLMLPEIVLRVLERSFGRKARKKYDFVAGNYGRFSESLIKPVIALAGCGGGRMDFKTCGEPRLNRFISAVREKEA